VAQKNRKSVTGIVNYNIHQDDLKLFFNNNNWSGLYASFFKRRAAAQLDKEDKKVR